jgi:hypothetical protein
MVSFINTCHLQQGRTNPEYSIVPRKTYQGRKDFKDMQASLAYRFIAAVESITKRAFLYLIFISSHH